MKIVKYFFVSSLFILMMSMFFLDADTTPCSNYLSAMMEARAKAQDTNDKVNECIAEAEDIIVTDNASPC